MDNSQREQVIAELQHLGYDGLTGLVQDWGHRGVEKLSQKRGRTLELGIGEGRHYRFAVGAASYVGIDINLTLLRNAARSSPRAPTLVAADAGRLPFRSGTFDRAIAIYNLEHIANLDAVIREIARTLAPGGELVVALPTEGGLAWDIGRRLTTKRSAERRFPGLDYLALVKEEHVQTCRSVLDALRRALDVQAVRYLPFRIPSIHLNAVVVARCVVPAPGSGH